MSPVSELVTLSGIFSPNRMLDKDSVSCQRKSSVWVLKSSLICFIWRRKSDGDSFSCSASVRLETLMSITIPCVPDGTLSELSLTSAAFSPNIARKSFSSGAKSVSLFGVIFPTRISPGLTSAPMRTTPRWSRFLELPPLHSVYRVLFPQVQVWCHEQLPQILQCGWMCKRHP